jgi:Fe-S cluster biogenesis protein NfuA
MDSMADVDPQMILDSVGPVQTILDAHDGIVNVMDTSGGVITISLEGGCTGCSSTPMTAMQIYYSLMKLDQVNDVIFVNGELPVYMRSFINQKLGIEQ